jgi:hypothetical protein
LELPPQPTAFKAVGLFVAMATGLVVASGTTGAEPRVVRLKEELESAKTVAVVRVETYSNSRLRCRQLNSGRRRSFRYSDDPMWNPRRFVAENLDSAVTLTGMWPPVGSEVLIVVDREGIISLFAHRERDDWRYWSPRYTESMAQFYCGSPARPFPGQRPRPRDERVSWDGCLAADKHVREWLK